MAEKQVEANTNLALEEAQRGTNLELRKTSELLESLQRALAVNPKIPSKKEKETFKVQVIVNSALHLPNRKKCRSKRSKYRSKQDDIYPSTYVTYEFDGNIRITPVVPKNSNPEWKYDSTFNLPVEYLLDNQKKLIFKIWRKSTNTVMVPNMQADVVIGFVALDLSVLLAGLPNIQGWFNIIDCNGKTSGQINIHINPQEDLKKYKPRCPFVAMTAPNSENKEENIQENIEENIAENIEENNAENNEKNNEENNDENIEENLNDEPVELLGRALKRKFNELDEITQRLRLRLSKVTNDDGEEQSNDELADEFERDINTLCIEEDFDLIDFEQEAEKFNQNHHQKSGDGRIKGGLLQADKQKIDSLLEKLSILSSDPGNTSRYVSGCSTSHCDEPLTAETILNDLDHNSRPNIHTVLSFNNMMAQLYGHLAGNGERSNPDGSQQQQQQQQKEGETD